MLTGRVRKKGKCLKRFNACLLQNNSRPHIIVDQPYFGGTTPDYDTTCTIGAVARVLNDARRGLMRGRCVKKLNTQSSDERNETNRMLKIVETTPLGVIFLSETLAVIISDATTD
ncbi:hypothetical protein KIN20_035252 [Parelaphostrongylus tenuis]|uniref:Uncharacterized protein n=1 Tax=Parelaphostrongylus tenuis TaxID=148309 RepID=A0AAD5RAW8_PARTN|nr:hypothetical protein KIN20_035252 [Parelaphostrongylus tenuis]